MRCVGSPQRIEPQPTTPFFKPITTNNPDTAMRRIITLFALLTTFVLQQAMASTVLTSSTLPTAGKPEHLYTMANANGYYANSITAPTQTAANYGLFAFYAATGKSGAYNIYSYTAGKWLSYTTASAYTDCTGFVTLAASQADAGAFSMASVTGGYYELRPYTTQALANRYLNWYCGIGTQNPLDGTVSLGLYKDPGIQDAGSRWLFTAVTQHDYSYTIHINGGTQITIGNTAYNDGDRYDSTRALTTADIKAPAQSGRFAVVSIDDVSHTITVTYAAIPTQPSAQPYTAAAIYPMQQNNVGVALLSHTGDVYTLSNNVLAASFVRVGDALFFGGSTAMNLLPGTEPFTVAFGDGVSVPASAMTLTSIDATDLAADPSAVGAAEHFAGKALTAHYEYTYNDARLSILWRAVLRDGSHYLRTEMELTGTDDVDMYNIIPLVYNVDVATAGSAPEVVGNTRGAILMNNRIFAGLENPVAYNTATPDADDSDIVAMQGRWSRNTTLSAGETWKISAVVGLIAQDGRQADTDITRTQKRRSVLAYSERERAVPWRPYPAYISWYELNIDRNNAYNPTANMNAAQVLDVVTQWKTQLYDRYGVAPNSFVIDDGWDNYGTWTFHSGFPNEMRDIAAKAAEMNAGVGAWLGPVGGYGQSGDYRRAYWKNRGGMVLSNPDYYKVFLDAARNLTTNNGDFRFFKFDGISAQGTAIGPDPGDTGNENAEGIIRLERYIRENLKRDIFFNTTVGTWASPFWYHYTDATWRQDADYKEAGNNTIDRERWITYRDKLVYENYVTASPVCPINTLMTHGFILSSHGAVSKNMDYDACRREMRCAFACGSGMVELYCDYPLMNSIGGGRLWADLAECIAWQKRNADVLPDIHWVGGNPWDGTRHSVYGWASWNGTKATLALRNGDNSAATYTFTLRQALNIPAGVNGSIILRPSFGEQDALSGLSEGTAIDIDRSITVSLPASSVFCFDGISSEAAMSNVTAITLTPEDEALTLTAGDSFVIRATVAPSAATFPALKWTVDDASVATVSNGCVVGKAAGTVTVTATATDGSATSASLTLTVKAKIEPEPEDYAINFARGASPTRTDRKLTSVALSTDDGTQQTLTANSSKPYTDLSADASSFLHVKAGSTLNAKFNYTGSWMHGYVYIDADQNRQFSFREGDTSQQDTELISFSFYSGNFNDDSSGYNSLGTAISGDARNILNPPAFTAPEEAGTYRIRFKVDWNSVDPGGQKSVDGTCTGKNGILANGGAILDATLIVEPATSINGASADASCTAPTEYFDLSGRRLSQVPASGVYVQRKGSDTVKVVR